MLSIVCVFGMLIYGCLEFCRSMIFIAIADKLTRSLNIPTLRASIARSLSGEPSVAAQAVRDLDALRMFASSYAPIVSLDLVWTPIIITVLYLLHPWYGHYALLCAGILFVLSIANDISTRENLVDTNNAAAASLSDLSAALRQRELIDGLGMLPEIARHWIRRQNRILTQAAKITHRGTRFSVAAKTARLGMQAIGIAVGTVLVIQSEASPGSLIGASILLGKLLLPFEQLITAWRQWVSTLAAWRRMTDLLTNTPIRSSSLALDAVEGRLVIDRVGFAPASANAPILEEISLTIEPGEVVAIVGPSGSGKSTLARLVMGILQPTSGQVTLDGVPTCEWDRTELARHVGYLAQSIGLLDGTILDNIARMDAVDSAAAIEAANRAGVHDLIGRLRDGYGTQVGDSGQALSGGTRQRIALARALYGHPKLLVLDEPNANLDHEGEQTLVRVIRQVRAAGTAVLLVTHRPSILSAVDRIVGVERGRITRIEHATARPELANPGRAVAQAS
jgi:ATP-binding cassette subfamily C protein